MRTIALVGRGPAVRRNAERYALLDDVVVRALIAGTRDAIHSDVDVPSYATLDAALEDVSIDAVDVCGPAADYGFAVRTALDADLAVRCDPPLAYERDELDSLVSTVDASDASVMATSVNRFSRLYGRIHDHVESGGIGSLGVARITRTAPFPDQGWNAWYVSLSPEAGSVDVLVAVAAHDVDVLRWLFGPIERVFARAVASDAHDHVHVLLQFQSGAKGQIEVTWAPQSVTPRVEIELAGDHGLVRFDESNAVSVRSLGGGRWDTDVPGDDCYMQLLRAFLDDPNYSENHPTAVSDAVETTRVILAVRRSIAEVQPVRIDGVSV